MEQSASVQGGQGQGGSAPDHESAEGGTGVASGERERVLQCRAPPGGQNAELSHVVCSETVRAHMSVCDCEFAGRIAVRALFGQRDAPVEEY